MRPLEAFSRPGVIESVANGANPSLSAIRITRAKFDHFVFDFGFFFCYNNFGRARRGGGGIL